MPSRPATTRSRRCRASQGRRAEERPAESLAEIAAELAQCHERLIMPQWDRIHPVLDADIAYRSQLLAGGGARSLALRFGVTPSAVSQASELGLALLDQGMLMPG